MKRGPGPIDMVGPMPKHWLALVVGSAELGSRRWRGNRNQVRLGSSACPAIAPMLLLLHILIYCASGFLQPSSVLSLQIHEYGGLQKEAAAAC